MADRQHHAASPAPSTARRTTRQIDGAAHADEVLAKRSSLARLKTLRANQTRRHSAGAASAAGLLVTGGAAMLARHHLPALP